MKITKTKKKKQYFDLNILSLLKQLNKFEKVQKQQAGPFSSVTNSPISILRPPGPGESCKLSHPSSFTTPMTKPELLSPAGSLNHMYFAFAYGADAIYAGQPRYSLRVRNNEFGKAEVLGQGIAEAHARGRKFFLTSNIAPHNSKLKTYIDDLEPIIEMGPDALIMSDPGLIMMVRERWPEIAIHLSVQANVVNYAAVRFWQGLGLKRIILSRELSLREVAEIRTQCPDIELETFVHGSLSYRLLRALSVIRLHVTPRFQPGRLHQHLPLEVPSTPGAGNRQR